MMSQSDIYDFLKSNSNRYYSVRALSNVFNVSEASICRNLRSLKLCSCIVLSRDFNHEISCKGVYAYKVKFVGGGC